MPHAVIWGAGIAGLTSAIGLAGHGWSVEVRERGPEVNREGAALGIWPRAQLELGDLGIWDDVRVEAVPYLDATVRDIDGNRLIDLPLRRIEKRWSRPVMLVRRPVLMAALERRALTHPAITIEFGRAYDAEQQASADLVVAADGVGSALRSAVVGADWPARPLAVTAWRGSTPHPVEQHGEVWGRAGFAGVTPNSTTTTNWYVAIDDKVGVASQQDLLEWLAGWPDPVPDVVASTPTGSILRHPVLEVPPPPTYYRGNTVLVGDAAHAMAPSLGQGACQAILDATALVSSVAGGDDGVETALRRYNAERRSEATRVVNRSRRLLRLQLGTRGHGLRNGLLRLAGALASAA